MGGWLKGAFRPIEFARFELVAMRVLLSVVVWLEFPSKPMSEQGQPDPVGLARLFDLTFLHDPDVFTWCRAGLAVGLVAYSAGRCLAVALPAVTFLFLAYGALKNSQGATTHHLQVVGLVLFVQTVWYLWHAVANRRRIDPQTERTRLATHRGAAWVAMQALLSTYVVTAVTKIVNSGGGWVKDAKYFPVQLEKARMSAYYNRLEEAGQEAGGWGGRLTAAITEYFIASPNACRFFLASGLALELFAFLALASRRWAAGYGLLIIFFHMTISKVMSLTFTANMLVVAIFLVNVPYWLGQVVTARGRRFAP